ncbi:MAG: hypothetical protein WDW36_008572 [Sanguina aurantia]
MAGKAECLFIGHHLYFCDGNVAEGDLRGLDAPDNIRMAQNLAEEAQRWLGPLVQLGNDGQVKLNLARLLQMTPEDLEAKMCIDNCISSGGSGSSSISSRSSSGSGSGGSGNGGSNGKPSIVGNIVVRLQQLYKIFLAEENAGSGRCSPFAFNPRVPDALPEQFIGPSFFLSQTSGNCVLVPEFIGQSADYSSWTNLYERLACLAPSTQYLLLPGSYRGAGDAPESFQASECPRIEKFGPAVDVILYGDTAAVTMYKDKAEFFAALQTNATFDYAFLDLDFIVKELKATLKTHNKLISSLIKSNDVDAAATADNLLTQARSKLSDLSELWAADRSVHLQNLHGSAYSKPHASQAVLNVLQPQADGAFVSHSMGVSS